ncbi:progonadoliberin-2 [Zalophus californianus]|uniref:Progonadoliberin-2 n=1 Tax=Zalophus californianus TaxID=9704 RepID=A0A6J2FI65_ZALCA|nr:progonadoliberin-2 [Zalophus californianus]
MAHCRLGFLLLLTVHPGSSKAQHWSHGWYPGGKQASSSAQHPQHAPRLLGRALGTAASSPDQTALDFPSDPLAPPKNSVGRAEPQASGLRRKQHLVQTLLVKRGGGGQGRSRAARPDVERRALSPSNKDVKSLTLLPRGLSSVPLFAHPH